MKKNQINSNLKISVKDLLFLISYLFFMTIFFYWAYQNFFSSYISSYEYIISPWIFGSLLLNIIGYILIFKTPLTEPSLWYVLSFYLFMFVHIFLKIFNLETSLIWNPAIYFSPTEMFKGSLYALQSITCICFGYFVHLSFNKRIEVNFNENSKKETDIKMFNVGFIIFWIGFVCALINSYVVVTSTYNAGTYVAYADVAGSTGLLDDFSYLVIPGSLYILCSRKWNRQTAKLFTYCICTFFLIIMIFSGSRKSQLFSILTVLLCYNSLHGKNKYKVSSAFINSILVFLFLNLIYIIREYRTNLTSIIPEFFSSLISLEFLRKIFGETFAETGLSMYSVVSVLKYVPSVFQYEYGLTFIRSVLSIFPLGSLFPTFFNAGYSTVLINRYTGIPVGSSLIGDFYWNFGIIGALVISFFFGQLLGKIGDIKYKFKDRLPMYFSLLFIIFLCIRAGLMDIMRPLVIITVIPVVVDGFFSAQYRK